MFELKGCPRNHHKPLKPKHSKPHNGSESDSAEPDAVGERRLHRRQVQVQVRGPLFSQRGKYRLLHLTFPLLGLCQVPPLAGLRNHLLDERSHQWHQSHHGGNVRARQ